MTTHSTDHSTHDLALIAALADRDATEALSTTDLVTARALLLRCADCATLERDLLDLMAGVRMAATPTRPRDFRLTPADAERLRPPGWRRLLAWIGAPNDRITRPLALGLTTLGLVAVLVGTVPGALPFAGAGAGGTTELQMGAGASPDTAGAQSGELAPSATDDAGTNVTLAPAAVPGATEEVFGGGEGNTPVSKSDDANRDKNVTSEAFAIRDDQRGLTVLLVIGGTLLIVGLGLLLLRWRARRLG